MTLCELGERRLLELLRHLEPRRADLPGRAPEYPGAGVLGPVDAVAEPHQPVAAVEHALDVGGRVPGPVHVLEHVEDARGGATVEGARQRPDGRRERRRDVRAGGGDDPRGERGGVHAVLGG